MANEKRLIDANALMDAFRKYMTDRYDREKCVSAENCKTCEPGCLWRKKVSEAPTVDAVEVVHGRWLYDSGSGKYFCSACDEYALSFKKDTLYGGDLYEVCLTDYCPNCGAKMDGGTDDERTD